MHQEMLKLKFINVLIHIGPFTVYPVLSITGYSGILYVTMTLTLDLERQFSTYLKAALNRLGAEICSVLDLTRKIPVNLTILVN